jgi:3-oxoacyl-[acyl-carrier-protein] synthase III
MDIRAKLKEDKVPGIKTKLVTSELQESQPAKKETKEQGEKSLDSKNLKSLIYEVLNEMKPASKKKVSESAKKEKEVVTKEYIRNITEAGIIKYIEKAGTKNKDIQRIILEQARTAAQSNDNFKILKEVVKIMQKKRG